MLVLIAILTGMLGYFAFGATCDSVILLNLPNRSIFGILAKLFYCFTIMGSFVIVIQPIFYVMERAEWYQNLVSPEARSVSGAKNGERRSSRAG